MPEPTAREVRVTGHVQGVFFRAGCADRAEDLGVTGWMRNEADGSVTGHFEGDPRAVDALIAWCHDGPPRAHVDAVEVTDADVSGASRFVTD